MRVWKIQPAELAMTVITTRLTVAPDGTISSAVVLPAGEHAASITLAEAPQPRPGKPFTVENFPIHDTPRGDRISLSREDMYGDDGR
jgi:hypothetical protein